MANEAWNAAIAFDNRADDEATSNVTVSGAISGAPASNLLNPHVGKQCRVNADNTLVLIDEGSSVSADTMMLANVSGTNPTFRVRYSSVDTSGLAGDVYDSGVISGLPYFDPDYRLFVHLKPTPAAARYRSIAVTESGVATIGMGRLFDGLRNQFGINFQAPWSRTPMRRSVDTEGVGGQTFVDLRQGYWRQSAPFDFLSEAEANGFLEQIAVAIVNNGHQDMLWIKDPTSDNLSRDCIWGFHEGDWPRTQELYSVPPEFRVTFNIRQRG